MSLRSSLTVLALVFQAGFLPGALAQDFNVKVGFGTPSAAFGAASGQTGVWNRLDTDMTIAMVDVQGQPTSATAAHSGCYAYGCADCPEVCGAFPGQPDESILFNSWMSPECYAGLPVISAYNLQAGRYGLHLYAYFGCGPTGYVSTHTVRVSLAGQTLHQRSFQLGGVPWQGTWTGFSYGVDTFDVPQGAGITFSVNSSFVGVCGFQLTRLDDIQNACAGDGGGIACPCDNFGASGHGCANSLFAAGGLLAASGIASVSSDSIVLTGTNMSNASCTYFQGSALAPMQLFDGILCPSGQLQRIGSKINAGNGSSYPGSGDAPVSVRGMIPAAGGTYYYTTRYRNAANFCTPDTANFTNAIAITWVP